MHLNRGELRAYQDGELDQAQRGRVEAHLHACAECQAQAERLSVRSQWIDARLAALDPDPAQSPAAVQTARARLEARQNQSKKEYESMSQRIFSRRTRPLWAGLAVIVLIAAALAFPQVRAAANSFLGLFRVQQISVIQVDSDQLPEQFSSSSAFESLISKDVTIHENGQPQDVADAAQASELAGFPVRLPQKTDGQPQLKFQPGGQIDYKVDLQLVQGLLADIGRTDIHLPKMLDGATVSVDVHGGVAAMYGDCASAIEGAKVEGYDPDSMQMPSLQNCTTLLQMPSPTISAPPGLDMQAIGQAYLQVLGMSSDEAASFASKVDWTTTLVVPIPRTGMRSQDVQVDGVQGTLITQRMRGQTTQYLLLWVKDGIVYALTGPGDTSAALEIASSLK